MRWCLALLVLLARVAVCDGDAPTLSARVERVGALTFVVAMNTSAPGEVDIVVTRASEYPDWASASAPPSLVDLRAAVAPGGAISTATDPPPAYFRRTVSVPAANRETRVLVRGAYNLQRPDRSGAYGDFVVYPGAVYVVAMAPRDDADGTAQIIALETVTAASVSSDASLARLGVVVSATAAGVVDAGASASSAATATLAPTFDGAGHVRRYEASVDAEAEEVTVFALPAAGAAFRVEVDDVAARSGPARFGGAVPAGAYSAGRARVFYGRNAPMTVTVTAEDRVTTRAYQVRVTRSRSSEARLRALSLRSTATTPAFSSDAFAYAANVSHDTTSVRVFAEPMDARAQAVRVNAVLIQGVDVGGDAGRGVARESEAPFSRDTPLRVGSNVVVVEVTAHDASTKLEYRVEITRAYPGNDVELQFLQVASVSDAVVGQSMGMRLVSRPRATYPLTPPFVAPAAGASTTALEHAAAVEYRVRGASVLASARDVRAKVTMTYTRLEGWAGNATVGLTKSVDGKRTAFSPGGLAPAARVAEFDVDGLLVGRALLAITVTAEDPRYSKTTRVELTRNRSDRELRDLVAYGEPGSRVPVMLPSFDPETLEYDIALDFDTEAVRLVPVAEDPLHRAVRVNTDIQPSGESSRTYPVEVGGQIKLTVSVTAHDGETQRVYVVRVSRESPNADAALRGLVVMPAGARVLVPAFDPDVFEYNLSAPLEHTVASVRVAPTARDSEYGRVLVNGARQPSGALSREISVPAGYGNGDQTTRGETTVTVVVFAQDGITRRTYAVFIARDPAPIFPDDATLRELRVSPRPAARLAPAFAPRARAYRLFVPARASFAGVTPVANDANSFKIEVDGVATRSGQEVRITMAELLRREDVVMRIEVFAANCDPAWRPEGFDAAGDAYADEDGDGAAETLLLDAKYRPTWCSTRVYEVEFLEYGPGAYEGAMRLRAGDAEDPTGIVREMTPFPSPFGDTAAFLASLEQRDAAEFDGGVRSTGAEGECDEYLCANSIADPSLVSMELRVASVTPAAIGDDPLPSVGAAAGDAVAYTPAFSNVTRLYVAEVPSHRVDAIEINVTAASANISGVFVDGIVVRSGAFSAPVALKEGATTSVAVEVVAGREDERRTYALHAYRPRSNNTFLRSLGVQIGSVDPTDAAPIVITKRVALNLTGVPKPRRACDLYDAAARAASGVAFHPACDDPAKTNLTIADNDLPSFAAPAAVAASVTTPTLGRLTHPCDGEDAETFSDAMCAENGTVAAANFSLACDTAASAAGVLPVSGFHHEWFDYLVTVDDSTEFVTLLAEAADPSAERVGMGASFRNCRALPRSPGCAGRDVADVAAWGWTAGESKGGVVAVASGEHSPPLDLVASPGSTEASIVVVATDGSSRREYTLRVVRENVPPVADENAAVVAGVGTFLEALVKASPLGATTDEEVRFALQFAGMDPLHLADASFRRHFEELVRDYVAYAAVEPALALTATAAATPRTGGECRRRVAGSGAAFAPPGVDVTVVASFAGSAANATARLSRWVERAGWDDTSAGFAFDGYLRSFGPIVALAVADDGVGATQTRSVPAGFAPRRRAYSVAFPSAGTRARRLTRLPLVITPPPGPLADGYSVTVDGAPVVLGSTAYVPVPRCAAGPDHCDARRFETTVEACVGGGERRPRTCAPYVFEVTVPGASAFDADDATLRDVVVRYGTTVEDAVSAPVRTRDGGALRHDAAELFATVPRDAARVFISVVPNSPRHGGAFVAGRAVAFAANATTSAFASVSTSALLDAKAMGGVIPIRVFAEDGAAHRDVALRVRASVDGWRDVAESPDPLDALRGAYGFDGGGLPREWNEAPTAPAFLESYPRAEPLAEGGAHVELAAQTRTPAKVYWALAVPWTRAPTRRELVEAATRGAGSHARGPTRMVLDNRTFVEQNVSVYAYVANAVNASLEAGSGGPPAVEAGFVAAGVLGGAGTFGATREARATARCLDSRVAYRAYFVTERLARGVDAHAPGARERKGEPVLGEVTPALEATPGSALQGEC